MSKQNKIILIIAIALIAVGFILMSRGNKPQNNNVQTVSPIDAADHFFGRFEAPVQMIVYSDFQCPFCADFAQTMKQVEKEFSDKVAVVFRHYPLAGHRQAKKAAQASECAAEQGQFWQMHDKLFADNAAKRMSVEQFKKNAADLGLDQNKFNQCLDSERFEAKVAEQMAEGQKAGVTGTPTIFLNGNIYPGAYPFEDFTGSGGSQEKGMKSLINEFIK